MTALVAFGVLAGHASAQVDYDQQLNGTGDNLQNILPIVQDPINPSNPTYTGSPTQYLLNAEEELFSVNPATGTISNVEVLPHSSITTDSIVALVGQSTSDPAVYFTGTRNLLISASFAQGSGITNEALLPISTIDSMAVSSTGSLTLIGSTTGSPQGYTVNPTTGALTLSFETTGFSNTAFYQAYGPNGLLYVLDYGNNRMVMLDPNNGFAQVGQFTLNSSVLTANEQFAIGANGNIYLGDGLGGGSTYSSTGTYLNSFSVPNGTTGTPYTGASYLSTDSLGNVYDYNAATGMSEFTDTSVTPEPETWALVVFGSFVLWAFRRKLIRTRARPE